MTKEQDPTQLVPDKEQRLLRLLQHISLAVARADTPNDAFTEVLAYICRFMGWPLGHVYIWSEAANALVSSQIWYVSDDSTIEPFRKLSEATQFKQGEGTLGRVWETGEAISILDIRQETIFVRKMPGAEVGICAYFAFPVMAEGKVTAVLEFFSPKTATPSQDMSSVINHVSTLLGLTLQRQQAMARLQQSEAQLAEAQRTAHVGHWEWDIVHNKVTWSPEMYRIFGLSPHKLNLTYQKFLEYIHADDLEYAQKKIEEAYQNGRSFDYFHRINRPDGTERVVHARGRPIYDQAGSIVKLHGTAQDMTEQKETELKLAQSVRRLSALMEIGQAIAATLNIEQIYDRVLTSVRPLIGAEALILLLHQEEMLEIVAVDRETARDMHGIRLSPQASLVEEVWQKGRPLIVKGRDCVQQLSPKLKKIIGYQPEALLAVPVRWQEKAIGVLKATHQNASAFSDEDLRLLETAAVWTAIAIGNARQYKQLQRRLVENDAIVAISNALTEKLELDELLQFIVTRAQEIVCSADWVAIHLLRTKTNQLELVASVGLAINPADYLINMEEGIYGQVMDHGGVINVADMQTDSRSLPFDRTVNSRSLLVAPIESRIRRIGIISVQCGEPDTFTADDERLLTVLGVQVGLAIENARLFTSQRQAREKAERQRERMRHMAQRVVRAQEVERARIARELHDESGQSLTSLKISLDLIRASLPEELSNIHTYLDQVLELTDKTMSNLRLLSHNLRPPGLDMYGLDASLAGLCQDFAAHTHLQVRYSGTELPNLAALTALSLYRFAQEAVTNVAKHAEATEVQVTLTLDSAMLSLEVADNGLGFNPPDLEESLPAQGVGLAGMMERVEMVNGRLRIKSTPGQGSTLTAIVPYVTENK